MTDYDSKRQHQTQTARAKTVGSQSVEHDSKPFWLDLARFGAQEALITADKRLTYAELALEMVACQARLRGHLPSRITRPLIALEMSNDLGSVVSYLTALDAGWPVIMLEPGARQQKAKGVVDSYAPNLILGAEGAIDVGDGPCQMHPDLRLLLSTSGTTGAAKLVRLSDRNIASNAAAIATYLGLSGSERAITTLPLHYSYGLSVLHSHLSVGAPIILTSHSVTTPEFWTIAQRESATSLALVPAQAEALNPDTLTSRLPSLRYVTQAGGRLSPDLVRRFAAQHFSFFVMYGQTEASPRMAYLPPDLAAQSPDSIGRAIPGGRFILQAEDGAQITATGETGELIYHGPNVMMGYAETRGDLARGHEVKALRTGDLAEKTSEGLYRITGRKARFIKPFGLRIGLDEVEVFARQTAGLCYAVGTDDYLAIFVSGTAHELGARVAGRYGLPHSAVHVFARAKMPYLPSGKPDYKTLAADAAQHLSACTTSELEDIARAALGRGTIDMSRSFRNLGGDSLAYLQVQLWLSKRGAVPDQWEEMPLQDLQIASPATHADLPAELALRIAAICSVIALHSTDLSIGGGTYILLILAGYSLARFQIDMLIAGRILRVLKVMLLPILVGYYAIMCAVHLFRAPVPPEWFLLTANLEPAAMLQRLQPYWFVNAYAQVIVLMCLPFALKTVRQAVVKAPFLAGMVALSCTALLLEWLDLGGVMGGLRQRHPVAALELFLIGWCVFTARSKRQKLTLIGFFSIIFLQHWSDVSATGSAFMLAGFFLLLARASLKVKPWIFRVLTGLGGLTMLIYLLHPIFVSVALGLNLPDALSFALVMSASVLGAAGLRFALSRGRVLGFGGTEGDLVRQGPHGERDRS